MNILLTSFSVLILIACFVAYRRAERQSDDAAMWARTSEVNATKLKQERDRITVQERELDALRRELRKLSGKFYADLKAREDDQLFEEDVDTYGNDPLATHNIAQMNNRFPVCENWALAKQQGPKSEAAKCTCAYCEAQRAERARLRGELVPRTVQAQADLARLNAGKP